MRVGWGAHRGRWGALAALAVGASVAAWPASAADPKPDPAPVPAKPQPAEPAPAKPSPTTSAPTAPAPPEPAPSTPSVPSAPPTPSPGPVGTSASGATSSGSTDETAAAARTAAEERARAAAKAEAKAKAAARRKAEAAAAARARAAEAASANDVVALRIERARTLHELHERPFGLALDRRVAVVVPFEPPVAALPTTSNDGDAPLVGPQMLFALTGVACLLILLAGLPDALITSVGQVGILLERGRGLLLIGGAEILFAVAIIVLVGRSG